MLSFPGDHGVANFARSVATLASGGGVPVLADRKILDYSLVDPLFGVCLGVLESQRDPFAAGSVF